MHLVVDGRKDGSVQLGQLLLQGRRLRSLLARDQAARHLPDAAPSPIGRRGGGRLVQRLSNPRRQLLLQKKETAPDLRQRQVKLRAEILQCCGWW